MAKRKKERRGPRLSSVFSGLKPETRRGIWAILLFVGAALLIFAAFESAGVVGATIFSGISFFFGVGFYLLPILLVALGFALLKPTEHEIGWARAIGSVFFLLSGLGLIELAFDGRGGLLGGLIASPLVSLVDIYMSIVLLTGILIISVLVLFDVNIGEIFSSIKDLFTSRDDDEEELTDEELAATDMYDEEAEEEPEDDDYDESGYEEEEDDEPEDDTSEPAGGIRSFFGGKKDDAAAIAVSSYGGVYTPPPLSILEKDRGKPGSGDVKASANIIKRTLQNFGIQVEVDEVSIGPTVTRYAIKPAEGVRISKIVGLQNNLELALAAHPVRIEAPIPGRSLVGIEVPNTTKATVRLAALLSTKDYTESDKPLLVALGRDITGMPHFANIGKMPHVLIAGATGSGKSVAIHSVVTSLIYRNSPQDMRFIMIDPKRVELTLYNNIPHLLTPVITDPKKSILALKWAAKEMERRYDILEAEQVRDIDSYHKNVLAPALKKQSKSDEPDDIEHMPYIVIIIDELADIMQTYPRELEAAVVRLAQMSRAVGIHLILSTQRPSVNVITGLIKANIPARIALQVSSQIDSRTILDTGGAEKLLGAGDMLYLSGEMSKPVRIQTAFITEAEVKKVVKFLRENNEAAEEDLSFTNGDSENGTTLFDGDALDDEGEDDLYEEARRIVVEAGKASTSYLQRKLRVGYSRAARLMDLLEERGVIGPADGSRPREVLDRPDEGFGHDDEDERA